MRNRLLLIVLGLACVATPLVTAGERARRDNYGPRLTCTVYAAQANSGFDTTVYRLDLLDRATGTPIRELRSLGTCENCDLDALALDPVHRTLFGISGGDGNRNMSPLLEGDLVKINKRTGELAVLCNTGFTGENEIALASFRPGYNSLWAFQQGVGLVRFGTFNPCRSRVMYTVAGQVDQVGAEVSDNWEGLAWGPRGRFLYGATKRKLIRFNPRTRSVERVCRNLAPAQGMAEALEFLPNGTLVAATVTQDGTERRLVAVRFPRDPADFGNNACELRDLRVPLELLADDVEAITFEACSDRTGHGGTDEHESDDPSRRKRD